MMMMMMMMTDDGCTDDGCNDDGGDDCDGAMRVIARTTELDVHLSLARVRGQGCDFRSRRSQSSE